ncbi:MAG: hypothetical protein ACYS26_03880 [Planctomycetota bacterium]|jgi:hypothetical protein
MFALSALALFALPQFPPGADVPAPVSYSLEAEAQQSIARAALGEDRAISAVLLGSILTDSPAAHLQRVTAYDTTGQQLWQSDVFNEGGGLGAVSCGSPCTTTTATTPS